jgi:hypothetical protein
METKDLLFYEEINETKLKFNYVNYEMFLNGI